jgi:glyoxylase-like metal-dependent hydrolase (beta-lactamase superfamily II)
MEQVASNIYRLGSRSHNFYLMVDGGEATVIDAGCSREWAQLVDGLDALDLDFDCVAAVIATHAHADHIGLGARAQQEGVDVRVHHEDETRALGTYTGRFSAGATDLPMYKLSTWRHFLPMLLAGVTSLDHLDEVSTFSDGEILDLPGTPTVIHTPGHTEGHAMFHCPDEGVLFTGDGLITMNLLGKGSGPQMIDPIFNLDTEQAYESLGRLDDIDAELLLPGHGIPWQESPGKAARQVLTSRS